MHARVVYTWGHTIFRHAQMPDRQTDTHTGIVVEVKLIVERHKSLGEVWWSAVSECPRRECVWCESVIDCHSDPVGSPSLDQVSDVGLEWQVTSTVTHNLHTIHPLTE